MKLGAEAKKVKILGGLVLVAVVVYFINSSPSGEDNGGYKRPSKAVSAGATGGPADTATSSARLQTRNEREFRPSVRRKRGEPAPDPTTIDPTLRLDILAKLQKIDVEGTHRSIFDFGPAPLPPAAKPVVATGPKAPNPILPAKPEPPAVTQTPPPPQAPPIPMKFFGYISPVAQPNKRAFFMDGEDVQVVREGDVVRNRYKIVRIGVNSVVVEDLQFKSEQTLPLEEQSS